MLHYSALISSVKCCYFFPFISALAAAEAAAATTFARMYFSTPARLGGLALPFKSLPFRTVQVIFEAISFLFL